MEIVTLLYIVFMVFMGVMVYGFVITIQEQKSDRKSYNQYTENLNYEKRNKFSDYYKAARAKVLPQNPTVSSHIDLLTGRYYNPHADHHRKGGAPLRIRMNFNVESNIWALSYGSKYKCITLSDMWVDEANNLLFYPTDPNTFFLEDFLGHIKKFDIINSLSGEDWANLVNKKPIKIPISSILTYTNELSTEKYASGIRTTVSDNSSSASQRSTLKGAAVGGVVAGVGGALIGAALGSSKTPTKQVFTGLPNEIIDYRFYLILKNNSKSPIYIRFGYPKSNAKNFEKWLRKKGLRMPTDKTELSYDQLNRQIRNVK